MKYESVKSEDKYVVKYKVIVDKAMINKNHAEALKKLAKNISVQGFRRGHVPTEVLERKVDQTQLASLEMDGAINETMRELIDKEDLSILDMPKVSVTKYVPNDTLEYSVDIEVVPPVKLANPTKLGVKKDVPKVSDEQVDEVVDRLRSSAAKHELVGRAAKDGDEVVIDFTGKKDGVEFEGGKATDYTLKLGSGAFIPGFEKGIVGHKAGEEFNIDVTFPKEYGAKNMAGKKAVFEIKLKKVYELTLPELDDKFAESIAPDLKTLKALKDDIRHELERQEEASATEKYQNDLLEKLTEKSKLDIPEKLIDAQLGQAKQQFVQNLAYHGMNLEAYLEQAGLDEASWEKNELRKSVEKQVANSLVLTQLIKDYNIKVSDDEVAKEQAEILSRYSNPKIQANFRTDEAVNRIKRDLTMRKAQAKLAELNESK